MAPDPNIAPILKRLLSLDTPVARRILEIALMLGLITFASYLMDRHKGSLIATAAEVVATFGVLVVLVMIMVLVITVVSTGSQEMKSKAKDDEEK
jgi:Na+/proline symporter